MGIHNTFIINEGFIVFGTLAGELIELFDKVNFYEFTEDNYDVSYDSYMKNFIYFGKRIYDDEGERKNEYNPEFGIFANGKTRTSFAIILEEERGKAYKKQKVDELYKVLDNAFENFRNDEENEKEVYKILKYYTSIKEKINGVLKVKDEEEFRNGINQIKFGKCVVNIYY